MIQDQIKVWNASKVESDRKLSDYWRIRKALLDAVAAGDQDAYTELAKAHPAIAKALVNQAKGKRRGKRR